MGHAKGKTKIFQYPEGLVAEPGCIPELKGVAVKLGTREGGEEDAEFLQCLLLEFEPRGKLPEDGTQFLFQWRRVVEEKRQGLPAILQTPDVGDEPTSFHGKGELFRGSLIPALKNFFLGKAVKRDVQLYGVKMFGVELKPLFLGKIRRVEGPVPPMGVIVAARPDKDHLFDCGVRNADCGIGKHHLNV